VTFSAVQKQLVTIAEKCVFVLHFKKLKRLNRPKVLGRRAAIIWKLSEMKTTISISLSDPLSNVKDVTDAVCS
jgi:hypothetical protein